MVWFCCVADFLLSWCFMGSFGDCYLLVFMVGVLRWLCARCGSSVVLVSVFGCYFMLG